MADCGGDGFHHDLLGQRVQCIQAFPDVVQRLHALWRRRIGKMVTW